MQTSNVIWHESLLGKRYYPIEFFEGKEKFTLIHFIKTGKKPTNSEQSRLPKMKAWDRSFHSK